MNASEVFLEIETEVRASYFIKDVRAMDFEKFFDEIDNQNGYEEEWDSEYYKPFYFVIWSKIKKGEIK
jgi:hypothetical protein